MGVKPATKIQQDVMTNHRKNLIKSFKLPATKIYNLKRLSSINTAQQVNQKVDFEFEKIIMPKIQEAIYFTNRRINSNNSQALNISELPRNDSVRRFFLIKSSVTNKDWIWFYVIFEDDRIEGNYSFFYYTFEDSLITHYNLGKVYLSNPIC